MNIIDNADLSTNFHNEFDAMIRPIVEAAREVMFETALEISPDAIIAQILMNMLGEFANEGTDVFDGHINTKLKARLVSIADWMGPDWAQALYHTAVFITKAA